MFLQIPESCLLCQKLWLQFVVYMNAFFAHRYCILWSNLDVNPGSHFNISHNLGKRSLMYFNQSL